MSSGVRGRDRPPEPWIMKAERRPPLTKAAPVRPQQRSGGLATHVSREELWGIDDEMVTVLGLR